MRLEKLIEGVEHIRHTGDLQVDVRGLAYDSRQVQEGDLYFALPGLHADGAGFAADAVARGACGVVSDRNIDGLPVAQITVYNARASMADLAGKYFDHPDRQLKLFGVTGTNGKTTVAFLVKHILDRVFLRCGLIGTVRYVVGDEVLDAPHTTPESADVLHLLRRIVDAGGRAAAMEVSSHGLMQERVRGVGFDAAIFTNLTQDHLDYHGSMDNYFEAKARLFEGLGKQKQKKGRAIINADDRFGRRLIERYSKSCNVVTYGMGVPANIRASNVRQDPHGTKFQIEIKGRSYLVTMPLIGMFNVYNALAAIAAVVSCGVEARAAVQALADSPQVPGRMERVGSKRSYQVFVDYAHTDDALRNALTALRELQPARLICVFGCGGDRDRKKRPLMASVASELADWSILTTDNPRTEDPEVILNEIETGMRGRNYERVTDRSEAIRLAVDLAGPGDMILIAGKGHEKYQEVHGNRYNFDDVREAVRAIDTKRGGS